MRRFLRISGTLISVLLSIVLLGELCARSYSNTYRFKSEFIIKNGVNIETLILGSSHTYYGIVPKYLENAFSLANESQGFLYDYLLLDKYIGYCSSLKTVILPISYFSFVSRGFEDTESWWYAINYKLYCDIDYHSDFSKYNFECSNFPIYVKKIKWKLKGKSGIDCDSLGHGNTLRAGIHNIDSFSKTIKRHTAEDASMLADNISYIESIILLCKKHDVNVVLVTTPTWNSYFNNLDSEQHRLMINNVELIKNKYNLLYFDYLKDSRFTANDFYDCDHLCDDGAIKFSEILQSDLNKNGL